MPAYHFAIVCSQRSGSHLLATALNSHPDIACEGEIGRRDPVIGKPKGKIRGCIIMYNRIKMLDVVKPVKVIHLTRKAGHTALSRIMNSASRTLRKKEHTAHHFRGKDGAKPMLLNRPINVKTFKRVVHVVKRDREKVRNLLKGRDHITVKYEELTSGGMDVEFLNQVVADRLTVFLGVDRKVLRTPLQKAEYKTDGVSVQRSY